MSAPANKAIFLSYASQDAENARRICDALRAASVEVWFDQSELRGGDAWDAKIRKQIKECALFVPIISANTQARREGYFRIEWKLAAQRTHAIAEGTAFLLPVTIDDTSEPAALVPSEFREVQWTRVSDGDVASTFIRRVQTLLDDEPGDGVRTASPASPRNERPPASAGPARRSWLLAGGAAVVALTLAMVAFVSRKAAPNPERPPLDAKSIAVLPFESASAAPESADFTAGIHEEILTAVGKVAALKVIGRTSVLPYADPKNRNLRAIAAALGVATVVEGSVRRADNRVKIAVQLVDAQTSRQLWADIYDRELTDVFAIQSAIAQEVAAKLNATLTADERALLERRPTQNARAYELFLRAQHVTATLLGFSPVSDWEGVLQSLNEAVAADPKFAKAQALLALIHTRMYWYPMVDPSAARYERAREALAKTRDLAPSAPETALVEGNFAGMCDLDWAVAIRHYEAALRGLPNNSDVSRGLGWALFQVGRYSEAMAMTARAYDLNPLEIQSAVNLLQMHAMLRQYPAVFALVKRVDRHPIESSWAMRRTAHYARYEVDGNREHLVHALSGMSPGRQDRFGLFAAYDAAVAAGDWAKAAGHLADARLDELFFPSQRETVALHRALMAHLLGQTRAAADHARTAEKLLVAAQPSAREQPFIAVQLAQCAAFMGQEAKALQMARAVEKESRDIGRWDRVTILNKVGRLYALLGAREEALNCLRTLMQGPNALPGDGYGSPRLMRIDACWSCLQDDPRFEEILKTAKPL